MISVTNPLLLLPALPLAAAAVLIWRKGYDNLSARRRKLSLAVRLALIGVIVLGFAGATLTLPQSRQAVVFVVDLSNSDVGYKSGMQAMINASLARRPADSQAGVKAPTLSRSRRGAQVTPRWGRRGWTYPTQRNM